jgi:proteasome alpha subunit
MKDRADYARIGHRPWPVRGSRPVRRRCAVRLENPSQALHKVSEIYDRIAFAAVGRYNEFENLRIAASGSPTCAATPTTAATSPGRGLANAYAQTLGTIFSSGGEKPYEVELFVAEIGDDVAADQIYRLTYDGQVADVQRYGVMGGAADVVAGYLEERTPRAPRSRTPSRLAVSALGHTEEGRPGHPGDDLEVASWTAPQPRRASSCGSAGTARALLGDRVLAPSRVERTATRPTPRRPRRPRPGPAPGGDRPPSHPRLTRAQDSHGSKRLTTTGRGLGERGPADLRDRERVRRHVHVHGASAG